MLKSIDIYSNYNLNESYFLFNEFKKINFVLFLSKIREMSFNFLIF